MENQKNINKRAVVLLSGGLDSTTVLALAIKAHFEVFALSFDYGQRNRFELKQAQAIGQHYRVSAHRIVQIDLRAFGGSSLTSDEPVEKNRSLAEIGKGIPNTYVPARNTLFLSYALAYAEVSQAANIFIGVNAIDTSGYPDCRPEYIAAFSKMANLATRLGTEGGQEISIHTPLQFLNKAEIIRQGIDIGVDYSMTSSCYDPNQSGIACGGCDACILRQRGFAEAGLNDPLPYSNKP